MSRNSRRSAISLAYEELEILPLPGVHSGAESSQAMDLDKDTVFASVRRAVYFSLSSMLIPLEQGSSLPLSSARSGADCGSHVIKSDDVAIVSVRLAV